MRARAALLSRTPSGPRRLQRGQVLALALGLLAVALAGALVMYNAGQATAERAQLQDAADGAAWSGGLWVARRLNFMAYTNRAMVANHVAVGHLVSYVSWLEYVGDTATKIAFLTAWIPGISEATWMAAKVSQYLYKTTELAARLQVLALDTLNRFYLGVQGAARAGLSPLRLRRLMERVARAHVPAARVNDLADLKALAKKDPAAAALIAGIASEGMRLTAFVRTYTPSNDGGRIAGLSWASLARSRPWIEGNRGWKLKVPFVVRVRKLGSTRQGGEDLMDWKASDELQVSWWKWTKCFAGWSGWSTVARGDASARGLYPGYAGIAGYHGLRGKPGDRRLTVTALAARPPSGRLEPSAFVPGAAPVRMSAVARAEVYHKRPDAELFGLPGKGEHANLFNPFWETRLVR